MTRFLFFLMALLMAALTTAVQAKAERVSYPVSVTATAGGKITPTRRSVVHGAKNVKFSIRPDTGFAIAEVTLNGVSQGRVSSLTVPMVEGPLQIAATFVPGYPQVNAGDSDITTYAGLPVMLKGSAVPAVAGNFLHYQWKVVKKSNGAGGASFSDSRSPTPLFVPARAGTYLLELQARDGKNMATDTITVTALPSPEANPPVARPVADGKWVVGDAVALEGRMSYDPSHLALTYRWEIISRPAGSAAEITSPTEASASLIPDLPGTYMLILTVANQYAESRPSLILLSIRTNSQPVPDAGGDVQVLPGATVTLDGAGSRDADGDPITFSWKFQSCPQNICPQLAAYNDPRPSFVAEREGTYILSLTVDDRLAEPATGLVTVTAASPPPVEPTFLNLQWHYGLLGKYIGKKGLHLTDLDSDGVPEIIAAADIGESQMQGLWYVLRKDGAGSYEPVWRSEVYDFPIVNLFVADVTGDGRDDVIVGFKDGMVRIYEGPLLNEWHTFTLVGNPIALALGDLDADGKIELVNTDGSRISVHDAANGTLKWTRSTGGGPSIAVANVDGDPALEIVSSSGYVIDGISGSVEWRYEPGFVQPVAVGDVNGDGVAEIVSTLGWDKILIFDAAQKRLVGEVPVETLPSALMIVDVDDDGFGDIIHGDNQWGLIHAVDAATKQEKWSVWHPDHYVYSLAFGDVDLDGKREVLWGSGSGNLFVADPSASAIEWKTIQVDGPLTAVDVGDLDGDGVDEIVMVSRWSDRGFREGMIHVFDARTHALEYRGYLDIHDWMGVRSVRIGDVDGDGKNEFVVTTGDTYDGTIRVYDGVTKALKAQSPFYDGNYFTALAIADVDNDGKNEIVAGQGKSHTGARGAYLIAFDGVSLLEKWRSNDLSGDNWGIVSDIKVGDLDGDGRAEVVAAVTGERLLVFDGVTGSLEASAERPAFSLEIADFHGNGRKSLLVGRDDGKIDILDGITLSQVGVVPTMREGQMDALRATDLDGDGGIELLVTHDGYLDVLEKTGELKWTSRKLSSSLGLHNHLVIADTDGDGRKEVVVGSNFELYHFR